MFDLVSGLELLICAEFLYKKHQLPSLQNTLYALSSNTTQVKFASPGKSIHIQLKELRISSDVNSSFFIEDLIKTRTMSPEAGHFFLTTINSTNT